jgi:hypothetical protein
MSKLSIQFVSALFMLAAILAVSAQENTTALNNASMNTTLLNNTTFNATTVEPLIAAANEIVNENPVMPTETANETTLSENATAAVETLPAIPVLEPSGMQIGSPQRTTFAIGGTGRTPSPFSINGNSLAQGAYEIGLPAETIMDLSALPFFVNKI